MKILFLLFSFIFTTQSFADDCNCSKDLVVHTGLPSKNESWYNYWGLGLASSKYSFSTQSIINEFNGDYVLKGITWTADIFGFYFPTGEKSMLGGILNARGGVTNSNGIDSKVASYTFGPSFMYFFGKNIGDGWFVRADVGVTWAHFNLNNITDTAVNNTQEGLGLLAGAGYALPVSQESRLMFNFYVTYRNVDDMAALSTIFSFGVLL